MGQKMTKFQDGTESRIEYLSNALGEDRNFTYPKEEDDNPEMITDGIINDVGRY